MGRSKEWLLDALVWRSRCDSLLGLERERCYDNHVCAAAQAIVTRVLRLTLALPMRDIAVGIWQKIAGKNLDGGEEYEKHRRAAKRL
jgi:hypothetical protein